MPIPRSVIDTVLNSASIVDIVSQYTSLEPAGQELKGLSPFKTEKTPSFYVNPHKGSYYCFSTGKGGNVIGFLQEMEGLSFPEAVRELCRRYNVEFFDDGRQSDQGPKGPDKKAMANLYTKVGGVFTHLLWNSDQAEQARRYLNIRGIDSSLAQELGLGYAPRDSRWLHGFLSSKGFGKYFLDESALFSQKNKSMCLFFDRLLFPIHDQYGQLVGFGGRILGQGKPKYLNSPEHSLYKKSSVLYHLDQAKQEMRNKKCVYLVEGYMDVVAFRKVGITNVVAPCGTALTDGQCQLIKRFCTKVICVFDGDSAGQRAAEKALLLGEKWELEMLVVELPENKDPADIVDETGSQGLIDVLSFTLNALEYLCRKAGQETDINSPPGKVHVINRVRPLIETMKSSVKKSDTAQWISDFLSVSTASVEADLFPNSSIARTTRRIRPSREPAPKKQGLRLNSELVFLFDVVQDRGLLADLLPSLDLSLFQSKEIRMFIEDLQKKQKTDDLHADLVYELFSTTPWYEDFLRHCDAMESGEPVSRAQLNSQLLELRLSQLIRSQRDLDEATKRALSLGDSLKNEHVRDLLLQKKKVDSEILELRKRVNEQPG